MSDDNSERLKQLDAEIKDQLLTLETVVELVEKQSDVQEAFGTRIEQLTTRVEALERTVIAIAKSQGWKPPLH